MSNAYTYATVSPNIPRKFITSAERELLEFMGFTVSYKHDMVSVYADGDMTDFIDFDSFDGIEEIWEGSVIREMRRDLDGQDVEHILQRSVARSDGELPYLYIQGARIADRLSPDSHGGFASFITATQIQYESTQGWLESRIVEFEKGQDDA